MSQGGFGPPSDPYGGGAPFAGDPFAPGGPTPQPSQSIPSGPPPPRLRANTMATLSILFAFVFAPAGAVLGHLGLNHARRSGGIGRDRALIGLTLSYLVIVAAVVALVVWAVNGESGTPAQVASPTATPTPSTVAAPPPPTTTTPPPPPTVAPDALAGLLLSPLDVNTLMGDPTMQADKPYDTIEFPTPDQGTLEPADCMGSFVAGTPPPYRNSNWRTFQQTTQLNKQTGLQATQSVAQFDDAAAAQKALAGYIDAWRRCANTQLTLTLPGGAAMQITLGTPVDAGGGITTLTNTVAGSPGGYTRAIAAKNNVLIDNQISGSSLTDQVVTLTKRIADRIPG